MGALDSTIVILAFPTISSSLHSDMLTAIWIILVYLPVVAVCLLSWEESVTSMDGVECLTQALSYSLLDHCFAAYHQLSICL